MKIKVIESIAIEGEIIPLGSVIEVANSLGKELIWRGAASAVRYRPPEKLVTETKSESPKKLVK